MPGVGLRDRESVLECDVALCDAIGPLEGFARKAAVAEDVQPLIPR